MSEENVLQVKEMIPDKSCCFHDAKPMKITEDTSVIEGDAEGVLLPPRNGSVNLRRHSTGALNKRGAPGGKAQAQTRYRGNQTSSTHDLCKHGKRREDDLVIKPWKLVKNKNVEGGGGLVNGETLSLVRKSLVNVSKPDKSLHVAKRDHAASEVVKSCDGLRAKRSETRRSIIPSDSAASVRMVKKANVDVKKVSKSSKEDVLKTLKNNEKKTKIDEHVRKDDVILEKRVSRISEKNSSKGDPLKSLKSKEKKEINEPVRCDDVLEKTLYVVESSIEKKKVMKKKSITSVKSEIQQSSEKKILRGSGKKSLTILPSLSPSSEEVKEPRVTRLDPRPIRQITSRSKTGLSDKKESGSPTLVASSKTESKTSLKRISLKSTPLLGHSTRPVSFMKGKVLEPKTEDPTLTSIKFKKRSVVQEPKLRSDVNKNLKDRGEGVKKMSYYNSGEGKREKVVLRHRKVEEKKKVGTLFNNVIEETVNKLGEERKSRVKALVGAFETVISLQDNDKTSLLKKKIQNKSKSSQVVEG